MENELKYIKVSNLTQYIKNLIEGDYSLNQVFVEGEISGFKRNVSGHLYFDLKDEYSIVTCVMFKSSAYKLNFEPKTGDKVYVKGSIEVYLQGGKYQLYVKEMKLQGIGDLYLEYEKLKRKLEDKGYFNKERKKPLPEYPKNIAILTSKTGAVQEDLKKIILGRTGLSNIIIYPTAVQGDNSKYEIVKNIERANNDEMVDVIILARGGGSIEDLWSFNEEMVADAIFNSKKPIISAVGHQTDYTISDFVSDVRAATPSDAALIVVKDKKDLFEVISSYELRIKKSMNQILENRKSVLEFYKNRKIFIDKENFLNSFKQNLLNLDLRLQSKSPEEVLKKEKENLNHIYKYLNNSYNLILDKYNKELKINYEKLKLLNPLSVLEKGYSITFKDDKTVKSIKDISVDDLIETRVNEGIIVSKVVDIKEN